MTPKERAEAISKKYEAKYATDVEVSLVIEQAIIAAVEEADDRLANERNSYLERIAELEAAKKVADAAVAYIYDSGHIYQQVRLNRAFLAAVREYRARTNASHSTDKEKK